jgi:hypothetical protein
MSLTHLIDIHAATRLAWDKADPTGSSGPEYAAFEAAEEAVLRYPCSTFEEVREKARFIIENPSAFDSICNLGEGDEHCGLIFLRSLLGEGGAL